MTAKFPIALALMLGTLTLIASAEKPCVYDGKEYAHRAGLVIDGKCHMCYDGEWQVLLYNLSPERCTGKL